MNSAPKEQLVALYARVSTPEQDPLSQLPRLRVWAKDEGYRVALEVTETASARYVQRPEREKLLQLIRGRKLQGVAVVKLDRWGRSLIDIKRTLEEIQGLGASFYAIDQGIKLEGRRDPMGGFLLNVLGAVAELEADLISERTKASMAYVKGQGKHVGRPKGAKDKSPRSKKGYQRGPRGTGPQTKGLNKGPLIALGKVVQNG